MTQEQFRTRVERAKQEVFIITAGENGWRVRSAHNPSQFYLVSTTDTGLTCTCLDFESHAAEDPGWTCKHMLAVQGHEAKQNPAAPATDVYNSEERAAIQAQDSSEQQLCLRVRSECCDGSAQTQSPQIREQSNTFTPATCASTARSPSSFLSPSPRSSFSRRQF